MDQYTKVLVGEKARIKILKGVNEVYNTVRLTLGPEGKNALLPRTYNRGPRITNDGVTISENVLLQDPHERLAADAYKEGSKKTNEMVGDGTTTTAVIGGHLINKIFRELSTNTIPAAGIGRVNQKGARAIRKELKDIKDEVVEKIKAKAKQIRTLEDLENIAVISIGKEDVKEAKEVAKLVWEIGRDKDGAFIDNHVDVVEGYKGLVETEVIRGMRFPAKAIRNFVNKPEKFEMHAEDVKVFITNYKLDNPFEVVELLNILQVPKIALIAPDFSPMVIKSLIESTKNGIFCYPVKAPALRTEQLEDIASYTGATVLDKDTGRRIRSAKLTDLGFAEKIIVKDTENREDAVLIGGAGEKSTKIEERKAVLKKQLLEAQNDLTRIQLEKRIANLSSAIGIIRVGASTSKESLFLKLKIEDGVYACKAALQEGYVVGGGVCLKEIAEEMPENILTSSLLAPYKQIEENAGGPVEINETVIDPVKVVRLAVEHGVSVAATMITTDILMPEIPEISPGEGYEKVAKAISQYAYYWAKREGVITGNENEMEEDRNREFERVMAADKD